MQCREACGKFLQVREGEEVQNEHLQHLLPEEEEGKASCGQGIKGAYLARINGLKLRLHCKLHHCFPNIYCMAQADQLVVCLQPCVCLNFSVVSMLPLRQLTIFF